MALEFELRSVYTKPKLLTTGSTESAEEQIRDPIGDIRGDSVELEFVLWKKLSSPPGEESYFPTISTTLREAKRSCINSFFMGWKMNYSHGLVYSYLDCLPSEPPGKSSSYLRKK